MSSLHAMLGDYAGDSDTDNEDNEKEEKVNTSPIPTSLPTPTSIGPLVSYHEEDETGHRLEVESTSEDAIVSSYNFLAPTPSPQLATSHDAAKGRSLSGLVRLSPHIGPSTGVSPTTTTITIPSSPGSDNGIDTPLPMSNQDLDNDDYPFKITNPEYPPSPPGPCDHAMQVRVDNLIERCTRTGKKYNQELKRHKQFHNPRTVQVLVNKRGLDELGSNYPKELFDPNEFGEGSYYDELISKQMAHMKQRDKSRATRTALEFTKATATGNIMASNKNASQASSLIGQDPRITNAQRAYQTSALISARATPSSPKPGAKAVAAAVAANDITKRKSKWDNDRTVKTTKM